MECFSSRWFYLIGKERYLWVGVNSEPQSEDDDVGKRRNDTQHHSIPQLERQHGVHSKNDEEEQRHLKKRFSTSSVSAHSSSAKKEDQLLTWSQGTTVGPLKMKV